MQMLAGTELTVKGRKGIVYWVINDIPWVVFDGVWPPEKVSPPTELVQPIQLNLFEEAA